MAGAFNEFATGIGNTDAGFVMGTGKLLLKVPETMRFRLDGRLQPGVMAKDLILHVIGDHVFNSVTVSGERNEQKEEKGAAYHRLERRYGRFSRTMSLPCAVVPDECDARYMEELRKLDPKVELRRVEFVGPQVGRDEVGQRLP